MVRIYTLSLSHDNCPLKFNIWYLCPPSSDSLFSN